VGRFGVSQSQKNTMIVYANSCSFGAPGQGHAIYPEVIAQHYQADLINAGRPASCNRRIIRTTVRDLIEIKKQSNDILCLLGLSFISRTELWQPSIPAVDNDGNFHPLSVDHRRFDWSQGLVFTQIPNIHEYADPTVKDYYKQWLLHMSKEAIITDLLTDILMLQGFCQYHSIKILIWSNAQVWPGAPEVSVVDLFLSSLVKEVADSKNVIDPWTFCFLDYARSLGHTFKDQDIYGFTGHPDETSHVDFGKHLINRLKGIL